MKRFARLRTLALRVGFMIVASFAPLATQASITSQVSDDGRRVLAQCKPETTHTEVLEWCQSHALDVQTSYDSSHGLEYIQVPAGVSLENTIRECEISGLFEFAEPDYLLSASLTPNDRGLTTGQTWGLVNTGQQRGLPDADIDAPEAWAIRSSAEDVVVAVIDSGIRYTHEDLEANLWQNSAEIPDNGIDDDRNSVVDDRYGYNAVNHSGDPWDDDGHGTSVSGVIGAVGDNRVGTTGVAWKVQLMALKFLDSDGQGRTSDAISCIDYALLHGAQVINASWGGNGRSRSLERAIRRAQARNVLFVTAAGNDGANIDRAPDYPASYRLSNVITVGASTRTDRPSSASNFGMDTVDLFAPGSQIYTCSASSDRAYGFSSGTSLAAPFVTGAISLMIAADPTLSSFELTEALLGSVDQLTSLDGLAISEGRLNLAKALSLVSPESTQVSPRLGIRHEGADIHLDLQASPNQAFLLEASDDLSNWRGILRMQANSAGETTTTVSQTADQPSRFFRVRPLN